MQHKTPHRIGFAKRTQKYEIVEKATGNIVATADTYERALNAYRAANRRRRPKPPPTKKTT